MKRAKADEEISSESDEDSVASATEDAASTESVQSTSSELININTATVEQLNGLYGIGEVKAQRIIDYRESHGEFSTTYDITNVDGIGDDTYNYIKDYITVDG